jgi:YVTN family beta-propeller protein
VGTITRSENVKDRLRPQSEASSDRHARAPPSPRAWPIGKHPRAQIDPNRSTAATARRLRIKATAIPTDRPGERPHTIRGERPSLRRMQVLSSRLFALPAGHPMPSIARFLSLTASACLASLAPYAFAADASQRPIDELKPTAIVHLGKTADWVAITPDAVWVGSTGPDAVSRIDPHTNAVTATVTLSGEPCAGLATGFGSVWVPLCGGRPTLAKVDQTTGTLTKVFPVGPAASEGGVATSQDSVWLVIDKRGTLARIDPATGAIRQRIQLPPGSYNPRYSDGRIWVTRAEGAQITSVDADTGATVAPIATGPGPRFLTDGAGAIWTLDQGDGTLTRVDARTHAASRIPLATPGHGGDIAFGEGMIWTTVMKTPLSVVDAASGKLLCQWKGVGGDSLGIGFGAIWLTDYNAGTVSRIEVKDALTRCPTDQRRGG